MSEEASDVFGTQCIIKDGATYGFFQHTEQHNLLINLSKELKTEVKILPSFMLFQTFITSFLL